MVGNQQTSMKINGWPWGSRYEYVKLVSRNSERQFLFGPISDFLTTCQGSKNRQITFNDTLCALKQAFKRRVLKVPPLFETHIGFSHICQNFSWHLRQIRSCFLSPPKKKKIHPTHVPMATGMHHWYLNKGALREIGFSVFRSLISTFYVDANPQTEYQLHQKVQNKAHTSTFPNSVLKIWLKIEKAKHRFTVLSVFGLSNNFCRAFELADIHHESSVPTRTRLR